MHLAELQRRQQEFEEARGWRSFPASLIYVHLTEELGEIGRHILFKEGYKVRGLGHRSEGRRELEREFAQSLSLFMQLANRMSIDLEEALVREWKIMEKRFNPSRWKRYMEESTSKKRR